MWNIGRLPISVIYITAKTFNFIHNTGSKISTLITLTGNSRLKLCNRIISYDIIWTILYECRLCDKSKNWLKLSGNINSDAIGVVATVFYSMLHELN